MSKRIRVVHWGTGNAGRQVLQQIVEHPALELGGFGVHDPAKEGLDAGEFCGLPRTGVAATRDWDRLLAMDADCATYIVNEWGRSHDELIGEICALLESGKHVITTAYVPLVYAPALGPQITERIEAACRKGHTVFHGTGIEPGFTGDALPLTLSGLSQRIDALHVQERMSVASYDEPLQLRGYGFGRTPRDDAADYRAGSMAHLWSGVFHMLADGLNLSLDGLREIREVDVARRVVELPRMRIEAGQIAGVYFRIEGLVGGEPRLSLSHVYVVDDECGLQWAPQVPPERARHRNTRIVIEGSPPMQLDLALGAAGLDPTRMGIVGTASRVVNAIQVICQAQPGIRSFLNLPPVIARDAMSGMRS